MKNLVVFTVIVSLISCAGASEPRGPGEPIDPVSPAVAQKSPHGYVVRGDPERFGGFIGNCSDDDNFVYFWKCQSENAGNDFH